MDFEIKLQNDMPGVGVAGERVTLALQPQDVHDPTELPQYLAGYKPFQYRADEASAPILVDNDEDKYRTFDSDDAFRRVDVKGSTQGAVPEVDPKSALRTYKVRERYIGSFIPKQTESQTGNNYMPIMAATRRCSRAIQLDRELDVWNLLGTDTNWDASVRTAVAGGSEWNVAAGDPILDVETAVEKSAQPVSAIWMNQRVAHTFLRNENVRDQMRQFFGDSAVTQIGNAVAQAGREGFNSDFAIPGLPPFKVVASKVKNETTSLLDYTLADVAVLVTTTAGVPDDGEEIASSYTYRRRGPSGTGFEVRQFQVEGRGPLGGTMVVVSQADIELITADNAGGIITNVQA